MDHGRLVCLRTGCWFDVRDRIEDVCDTGFSRPPCVPETIVSSIVRLIAPNKIRGI